MKLANSLVELLVLAVGVAACSSSSSGEPASNDDAGKHGVTKDAASGDSVTKGSDPYQGIWVGTQGTEQETWTFSGGKLTLQADVEGCSGTYTTTGHFDLSCSPSTSAGSPTHTDDGTCVISGATMVCSYTYSSGGGTGSGSVTLTRGGPDPYAGTWTGSQGTEEETWTFSDGDLTLKADVEACSGTYTTAGHFDLSCSPSTSAGSPAHTDDGTCMISADTMTCSYTYSSGGGTGDGTVTLTKK